MFVMNNNQKTRTMFREKLYYLIIFIGINYNCYCQNIPDNANRYVHISKSFSNNYIYSCEYEFLHETHISSVRNCDESSIKLVNNFEDTIIYITTDNLLNYFEWSEWDGCSYDDSYYWSQTFLWDLIVNLNNLKSGKIYTFTPNSKISDVICKNINSGYVDYSFFKIGISPPRPDGIIQNGNNFITYLVEQNEVSLRPYLSNGEIDLTSNTYAFEIQYSSTGNEGSWITISNPANFVVPDYSTLPETYGKGRKLYLRSRIYMNGADNPVKYSPYFTLPVEVRPRLLNYKYSDTSYCNENETFAHFTVGALGQNDLIFLTTKVGDFEEIPIATINSANSNNNDYKVRIPITYETIHVKHTIIDANGYSQEFATYDIKLNNPHNNPTLTLNVINFTDTLNCFGDNNGQITLSASGGASTDYTYHCGSLSNKTGIFNGLVAKNYDVYVVDSRTCKSDKQTITINQPKELTLSAIQKNITCHGYNNGEVILKAEGGIGKYSYSKDALTWQDANTFNGLRDSTYKFYVKDKNGCRSYVPITITQPSAVSGSIVSQTNVSCYGGNNGSVTVSGSGGTPPYMYKINGGTYQSNGTFSGLTAGTYTVTIRDSNMCTSNVVVTITQPSAVSGKIDSQTNVSCHGGNNGSVTVSGSGGTPPYMYKINGGTYQSNGTFSGLTAGTDTVTIRDSNMCTSNVVVTITQPSAVSGKIDSQTNVSCYGGNNGSVTVSGSGGAPPYMYRINGGTYQSSGTFNGLIAGTYTVTIRDANMCPSDVVVTITQPSAVSGSIVSQANVSCYGGNNGSVTVSGSGGTPPYMYRINGGTYQSSGTFNGLIAGTHTVTIRDSNMCTSNVVVTITQPSAVSGKIESQTNVSCYGGNNGSVTVSGSGGTPPYTFTKDGWSTTVGPTYNTYTFSGLSKGYYNLVGKDANGCTIALPQVNITSPSQLVLENIATTHNRCFSGSEGVISIKAAGGTAPYSYTVDNGLSWSADSVFSGLTAGNYYARVKDSLGCTINPTLVSITQPADSFVLAVETFKNVSCFGGNDGEVSVYVALGGHPPFTYSSDGVNWQPERVFNQLAAGNGYLYATDSSGCTVKVKNPVTQPEPISATVIPYHVDCKGATTGKLVLSIAGGVGSYQVTLTANGKSLGSKMGIAKTAEYSDLPAGTYDLTIIDSNGCIKEINGIVIAEPANALHLLPFTVSQPTCFGYSNGKVDADAAGGWGGYRYTLLGAESSNGVFSGLKAGAYSIAVADSLGCKVQKSFTLDEPDPLALDVKVSDVQCYGGNDGRVEVTATGGTPQYSFAITGNEILPKGTNSELSVMENLTAGNYTIWLYDNHGCSTSKPISISQPPKLQVLQNNFNSGATDKTCTDTVLIAPIGGVAPYTLQFPDSAAIDCPAGGYLLHSLPNGRYPFRITDSHGCTVDDSASISNLPPPTLELVEVVNASCSYSADGSITVQAFSGTNWVEVKWNNGASGNQLVGVPAGRYTAVATDLYGCTHAETYEISKPDTLIVSQAMVHNPTCHGGTDAGISVIVTGGTKPYSYLWSNGVQADSTGHVPAGVYSVTVTDSNGCTTSGSYTLTDPPSMQPSLPSLVTLCTNQTYIADAGVMGTSYLWLSNNGFTATTAKVELSASGEYYLIVTDGNGCVGRDTIRIESYNGIIDADFLIADRASVNDTIVLIEMSWPIPQAIQWLYPTESFSEIYRTDYSLFLIPLKEGLFTIGLMTYSGPCNQYIEKKITIGPSKELRNADSNLPLFKNIGAFPNPNNGQFELLVELNSQADIVVEIFTLYGKRILLKEFRGQSIYRIPSAINPILGIYLIRITSGHHSESVRIVVQ